MDQGVCLNHLLNKLSHLFGQCRSFVRSRCLGLPCKARWVVDTLDKLLGCSAWVVSCHDGTDDSDAIQSLPGRFGLVDHTLNVRKLNTADGDGPDISTRVGNSVKNRLRARGSEDVFCVRFTGKSDLNHGKVIDGSSTEIATYVGVANMVPIPR